VRPNVCGVCAAKEREEQKKKRLKKTGGATRAGDEKKDPMSQVSPGRGPEGELGFRGKQCWNNGGGEIPASSAGHGKQSKAEDNNRQEFRVGESALLKEITGTWPRNQEENHEWRRSKTGWESLAARIQSPVNKAMSLTVLFTVAKGVGKKPNETPYKRSDSTNDMKGRR